MPSESAAIELRSINRLLVDEDGSPARYWIPAYQRGYRWDRLQVTQLLDDIWDFIQASEEKRRTSFYCLQPLVVRKLEDGGYEVVDGQQRLTTIFILLSHRNEILTLLGKQRFSIDYETRDRAFLDEIDLDRSNENVDFYHICQAWLAIEEWLAGRDRMHALKLLQHLLNDDEAGRNVKVIWYELAPNDDPVAAFTRLNIGKIPLTEAELVRALFLRRAAQDDATGNLSLRIAYEWDQIEKRLQDNSVWYFLQNADLDDANRIGLVFRLAARMEGHALNGEDYAVFSHFSDLLSAELSAEIEWRKVKDIFMALEEWYEDRYLFHVLGFVLNQTGGGLSTITELLADSQAFSKHDFSQGLRNRVYRMVLGSDLSAASPDELEEEITNLCRTVDYANAPKVRSLLLLFNLATLLEDPRSNIRFQFDSFKRESWDIEHIRSVSDERPSRPREQDEWLRHCLMFLRTAKEEDEQALAESIEAYLDPDSEPGSRASFEEIDGKILSFFNEAMDGPDHDLANLTLLDSRTNRGYRNAVFAVKRSVLLENDRSGIFVPLCTRNVFLKCYSRTVGNVMFWTDQDGQDYLDAISRTLTRFFLGQAGASR
ncbi:Protein of unknown function DUF262 [Paracoccus alcaliphilus]|uniref:GmrSD restriction endonucleases N-terminal domain-containing protein n=1 Tax=Paracoccus alcaliphilus TaxID=34002 RepID=A0A1H8N3D8_9RHOB|nr:DUF262 domain-containing protein [Paracoccus alcaliphilus]WCR18600.1 DUF262 domain-containing protein [Paracoccus alcaliphilus]SEO23983.1 Protein of unknown function DUF262 [Paracoccus alcaliphilus]